MIIWLVTGESCKYGIFKSRRKTGNVQRRAEKPEGQSQAGLNLSRAVLNELQTLGELGPMLHDNLGTEVQEARAHLGLLLGGIAAHVANGVDAGANGRQGARLAVLDRNSLGGGLAANLQGMQVDGGVRLGGGLLQRSGGTEDHVGVKVLVLADLLDGRNHATESRRGNHGQMVLLLGGKLLQLLGGPFTGSCLGLKLGNDPVFFLLDVHLQLVFLHLKLVLGLEADHHTAEVLADKVLDQLLASVAIWDTATLQNLVGQIGACLKGQDFRQHQSVVAVKEDFCDLCHLESGTMPPTFSKALSL